jgi:hypothetical protein
MEGIKEIRKKFYLSNEFSTDLSNAFEKGISIY